MDDFVKKYCMNNILYYSINELLDDYNKIISHFNKIKSVEKSNSSIFMLMNYILMDYYLYCKDNLSFDRKQIYVMNVTDKKPKDFKIIDDVDSVKKITFNISNYRRYLMTMANNREELVNKYNTSIDLLFSYRDLFIKMLKKDNDYNDDFYTKIQMINYRTFLTKISEKMSDNTAYMSRINCNTLKFITIDTLVFSLASTLKKICHLIIKYNIYYIYEKYDPPGNGKYIWYVHYNNDHLIINTESNKKSDIYKHLAIKP
jgi:hypothetical protein